MAHANATAHLGFLTVLQEAGGFLGGYLVTNTWGRPLEFRLSTAVQPNRVQQILYGPTLPAYVQGEVIGRALVEKTSSRAAVIFTDRSAVLDLRNALDVPVIWLAGSESDINESSHVIRPSRDGRPALVVNWHYAQDSQRVEPVLEQVDRYVDLLEPFARIRDAVAEARKLGVTNRG